ncbi:MAG: phosphotransferase [Lentisphaerae bacterium]|nr:phosphotransferase [Lentisphaerota bacterium]MCP4101400.1 phosphotransferase [Lentisphaerota bacterium]
MVLMDKIKNSFGLPDKVEYESVGEGHMNDTWIVSSESLKLFALRKYNSNRSYEDVQSEHQALQILEKLFGALIASPLKGEGGNSIQQIDGSLFALFPFKKGVHPREDKRENIEAAAIMLAFVHYKLWQERHLFAAIAFDRAPILPEEFLSAQEIFDKLYINIEPDVFASIGVTYSLLKSFEDRAKSSFSAIEPYAASKHLIHGDFGLPNLLVEEKSQKICTILDWEEMRWDCPVFEIAAVLPFYEMAFPDAGNIFIEEYILETDRLKHPDAVSIKTALEHIESAKFLANFWELTLMIKSGNIEPDYIKFLCEILA